MKQTPKKTGASTAVVLILLGCVSPVVAQPSSYALSIIVSEGDTVGSRKIGRLRSAWINDERDIVFRAELDRGDGLFNLQGPLIVPGDTIDGRKVSSVSATPTINSSGQVVVQAKFVGGARGIVTPDRVIAATGDTTGGKTLTAFGYSPHLSDNGTVGYYAEFVSGNGILTQTDVVAVSGGTLEGSRILWEPSRNLQVNASGDIVFHARTSNHPGIFTQTGVVASLGDILDGVRVASFGTYPMLNDHGVVSFIVSFEGGSGLFTPDGSVARTGDVIDGRALSGVYTASRVNNAGDVVLRGRYAGTDGLFTLREHLVSRGDTIDGKTIRGFVHFPKINNRSDAVFICDFHDGTTGLVVAYKLDQAPPASHVAALPATLVICGLVVAVVGGLLLRRRAKKGLATAFVVVTLGVAIVGSVAALLGSHFEEWSSLWKLSSAKDEEKRELVRRLGELRSAWAAPQIGKLLREEAAELPPYSYLSEALVRIGEPAEPTLIAALDDEHVAVKRAAAGALGRLDAIRSPAVSRALIAQLSHSDEDLVRTLTHALTKAGAAAVPELVRTLKSPGSSDRRLRVLDVLERVGPPSDALSSILPHLESSDRHVRSLAVRALAATRPVTTPLLEALLAVRTDAMASVRVDVLRGLSDLAPTDARVVAGLEEALSDHVFEVRQTAVAALGRIARRQPQLLPVVFRALEDESEEVQIVAAYTTATVAQHAAPAIPSLLRCLDEGDERLRRASILALGTIGESADVVVPRLTRALEDRSLHVRAAAASALGAFGDTGAEIAVTLKRASQDRFSIVRNAASAALRWIDSR